MKIRNQHWIENEKAITINLREPYWSAWKRYNWARGFEGFGISKEAIDYAIKNKKKIIVHVFKYGTYEINKTRLQKEALPERKFIPRDKKPIYVLPKYAFQRVQTFDKKEYEEKEHKRAVANAQRSLL